MKLKLLKLSQMLQDLGQEEESSAVTELANNNSLIQSYLALFFPGTTLVNPLGSGAFSSVFLAEKDGKKIAIKLSKSPIEYRSYLRVKTKRDSLPDHLRKILPIVYEANEISHSDFLSLKRKIKDKSEVNISRESFPYRSFIATELLAPIPPEMEDLLYEPNILGSMVRDEAGFISKLKKTLDKYFKTWDWSSFEESVGEFNSRLVKKIFSDNSVINIISTDISLGIFDLQDSDEQLFFDTVEGDSPLGGSLIDKVVDIFIAEISKTLFNFAEMNLPPRGSDSLSLIKDNFNLLISNSDSSLREILVELFDSYGKIFPVFPSNKIKNVKLQGFLDKLNELKDYGIRWGDTHSQNLMLRQTSSSHGFGDMVVADVGMFRFID